MAASPENPDKENLNEPLREPFAGADTVEERVRWLLATRGIALDITPEDSPGAAEASDNYRWYGAKGLAQFMPRTFGFPPEVGHEPWHYDYPNEEDKLSEKYPAKIQSEIIYKHKPENMNKHERIISSDLSENIIMSRETPYDSVDPTTPSHFREKYEQELLDSTYTKPLPEALGRLNAIDFMPEVTEGDVEASETHVETAEWLNRLAILKGRGFGEKSLQGEIWHRPQFLPPRREEGEQPDNLLEPTQDDDSDNA